MPLLVHAESDFYDVEERNRVPRDRSLSHFLDTEKRRLVARLSDASDAEWYPTLATRRILPHTMTQPFTFDPDGNEPLHDVVLEPVDESADDW